MIKPHQSQRDQEINYIYHVYSGAFEDMELKEVDIDAFIFIPRCLWDVNCDHYHACKHELAWKQYCNSVIEHALTFAPIINPEFNNPNKLDTLDILVWYCFHTNLIQVVTSMYCGLGLSELICATSKDHDELHDIFIKYIEKDKQHDTDTSTTTKLSG